MASDPAPYGADLPRERPDSDGTLGGYPRDAKWRELRAALDAANAEVLALRRRERVMHRVAMRYRAWSKDDRAEVLRLRTQRDALDKIVADLHEQIAGNLLLRAERDALREVVEAVRKVCAHYADNDAPASERRMMAEALSAVLPAPTEESDLYPTARAAVAPTTTPQAPGGSGANTGEAGRG